MSRFKEFVREHLIYFIIGGCFLVLVISLVIFLVTHKDSDKEGEAVDTTAFATSSIEVPKDKYEVNAYPNVTSLMEKYYTAIMNGDADTVASLSNTLSDQERYRIEEKAKFYQSFSDFKVYTKKGYEQDSYLVLVTFNILYSDTNTPAPSLDSAYVCTNETGSLYINKAELSDDEQAYLLELSVQSDVVELMEEIELEYNKALDSDAQLAARIPQITSEINEAVKTKLSEKQREEQQAQAEAEAQAQQEAMEASATTVKATDVVNIRASASTDSDAIGKAAVGDTYKRYEEMDNGWSKIDFNGQEAYIKSEFLEVVDTGSSDAAGDTSTEASAGGKITVKENVNVREQASEISNKLGVAYRGDQYELVERAGDWCKIKYEGKEAYVKSDFVQ